MEGRVVQVGDGVRDGSRLYHSGDGFFYIRRELRRSRLRMRCRQFRRGCPGTAVVRFNTGEVVHLQPHNHPPDPLVLDEYAMRRAIVEDAGLEVIGRSVNRILLDWRNRCPNGELAMRFTTARMYSTLYTARAANYPKIPSTLAHLGVLCGLPNMRAVLTTSDGQDLIFKGIAGSIGDKTVSLVFVSGRMLQFLQQLSSLHADGTFKKRPRKPKSSQIFNIVTRYGNTVIAVVRTLMMRRNTESYLALFRYLKVLAPNLQPARIHCDFEVAQINAWRAVFPPPCEIVGCLWHYAVAVSSNARKHGLKVLAMENDNVFMGIRCLCAAPLLPKNLILRGVGEIWLEVVNAGLRDTLDRLFVYWINTWIPRLEELSVFGFPERTNNCSETDNRGLDTAIPQNHPNVWHMIGGFKKLEYVAWLDKLAVDNGRSVRGRRRWKALLNDANIQRYSDMLTSGDLTPGQFLHRVSWSLLGPVRHGLRFRDEDDSDAEESTSSSESSDSEEDSD